MKRRRWWLVGAFVIAGGSLLLFHFWPNALFPPVPSLGFSFGVHEVEKIQFGTGGQAGDRESYLLVTLVKAKSPEGEDWRIPDLAHARADSEKVSRFLNQIFVASPEWVTSDSSRFGDFGIRDREAFRVMLFNGTWKPLASLLIGTKTEGGRSFIRLVGSNHVYRLEGNLLLKMGVESAENARPAYDYWLV